jgi:peptidoglycan/LPS O-acetylase OafA/YrhL
MEIQVNVVIEVCLIFMVAGVAYFLRQLSQRANSSIPRPVFAAAAACSAGAIILVQLIFSKYQATLLTGIYLADIAAVVVVALIVERRDRNAK